MLCVLLQFGNNKMLLHQSLRLSKQRAHLLIHQVRWLNKLLKEKHSTINKKLRNTSTIHFRVLKKELYGITERAKLQALRSNAMMTSQLWWERLTWTLAQIVKMKPLKIRKIMMMLSDKPILISNYHNQRKKAKKVRKDREKQRSFTHSLKQETRMRDRPSFGSKEKLSKQTQTKLLALASTSTLTLEMVEHQDKKLICTMMNLSLWVKQTWIQVQTARVKAIRHQKTKQTTKLVWKELNLEFKKISQRHRILYTEKNTMIHSNLPEKEKKNMIKLCNLLMTHSTLLLMLKKLLQDGQLKIWQKKKSKQEERKDLKI